MGTPPAIRENLSNMENQGNNISNECMSSGGMNLGWFQGIVSRGGAEFDENGYNLTEDINFEIGTTLVGIEVPEELHSSGINQKQERDYNILMVQGSMPWPRPMMATLIEGLF